MANLISDPPDDGCVLLLSGAPGGGNRLHDAGPCGNHGAITGAIWTRLPGVVWCLTFDGVDDCVVCGGEGIFSITQEITVVAWARRPSGTGDYVIIGKDRDGAGEETWFLRISGHVIEFRVYKADDVNSSAVGQVTVDDNVFHQIAARYRYLGDGASFMDVTIDGRHDVSVANAVGPIQSTVNPITIGQKQYTGYEQHFSGQIALPRIYNRFLSRLEIQTLFQNENPLFGVW